MSFSPYGKDIDLAADALKAGTMRKLIGVGLGSYRISEHTPFEAPDPAYWVANESDREGLVPLSFTFTSASLSPLCRMVSF